MYFFLTNKRIKCIVARFKTNDQVDVLILTLVNKLVIICNSLYSGPFLTPRFSLFLISQPIFFIDLFSLFILRIFLYSLILYIFASQCSLFSIVFVTFLSFPFCQLSSYQLDSSVVANYVRQDERNATWGESATLRHY